MKKDQLLRGLLWVIALLLFLNLVRGYIPLKPAVAGQGEEQRGRYQIAAWGAQAGAYTHHSGYYVLDTATGKVVASKMEVHAPGE